MTVDLVYDTSDATDGALVAAVEIVNDQLVTVATTVLRARRPVTVTLPAGDYLAHGWSPSGQRLWTTFTATQHRDTVVIQAPTTPDTEPSTGWMRYWHYSGREWSLREPPAIAEPGTIETSRSDIGRAAAVQVGGGDRTPWITLVPAGQQLRLDSTTTVSLVPDSAATLLGYLHRGDLLSAGVVARQVLLPAARTGRSVLDLLIGYYLVRTGDERAHEWVADLLWAQSDSVDVAVLYASLLRRDHTVPVETITDEFLRAASNGLPIVATGLDMLTSGLAAATRRAAASALDRLRTYTLILGDGPLTTFPADEPARPNRHATPRHEPPPGATIFALGTTDEQAEPADHPPAGQAERLRLRDALRLLRANGIGLTPMSDEVSVGSLTVTADVTRPTESESLRLTLGVDSRPPVSFDRVFVDLSIDNIVHFLSAFDGTGRCRFIAVPLGAWELTTRYGKADGSVPLPQPAEVRWAAADSDESTEILRVMLPDRSMVVLRQNDENVYSLELVASATHVRDDAVTGIEYEQTDGESVFRALPSVGRTGGRRSSTIRLDGFNPRRPWRLARPASGDDDGTAD